MAPPSCAVRCVRTRHRLSGRLSFNGFDLGIPTMQGLVTVFGGSGFIGRYVVRALAAKGWRVRVATRRPFRTPELMVMGAVGQIELVQGNVRIAAAGGGGAGGGEGRGDFGGGRFGQGPPRVPR